jgi:hypothetical protein
MARENGGASVLNRDGRAVSLVGFATRRMRVFLLSLSWSPYFQENPLYVLRNGTQVPLRL